ncbi:hypothetical protein [Pontiella sulfatireligans]|uniref:Uncharacterized protein n=1 Tax=Pontiella sulfatireligans TaxID=2750658 RepID=A0A6C2UL20_9BACT|nr:hypothetical protein [Pontiella sulfatireligans]VGO20920.1 hypothetical protein SCARR_02987 [Pontiella sulfatireligans]
MSQACCVLIIVTSMLYLPILIGLWVFGLRRYIRKKGKTVISAITWGLSIWADWTVAWEIGRQHGKVPASAKAFLLLHLLLFLELVIGVAMEL